LQGADDGGIAADIETARVNHHHRRLHRGAERGGLREGVPLLALQFMWSVLLPLPEVESAAITPLQ
jgi:hypothetical protein